MLYPSAFDSEKVARLSDRQFRLWVWMISQADDEGRGQWWPARAGAAVNFADPSTSEDAERDAGAICEAELAEIYEVNGERFYQMHDWKDFQRVQADRRHKSSYPVPDCIQSGSSLESNCLLNVNVNGNDNDNRNEGRDTNRRAKEIAEAGVAYINELAKGKLSPQVADITTLELVAGQLIKNPEYTLDDFKRAADKCAHWLDDGKPRGVRQGFRPRKLWGPEMQDHLSKPDEVGGGSWKDSLKDVFE